MGDHTDAEVTAMVNKYFENLKNDICPQCETAIKAYQQVGRCVYARPCDHRLYQGRVPDGKPKVETIHTPYEDA